MPVHFLEIPGAGAAHGQMHRERRMGKARSSRFAHLKKPGVGMLRFAHLPIGFMESIQ
jgi:hypothetical protein